MRRAFTLSELLVGVALGLALMGLGLLMFRSIGHASLTGGSQLELQVRVRECIRRLTPLVKLATPPNSQQTAIYAPDIGVTASNCVYCSPEDSVALSPPAFDPRNATYTLLQVRWDTATRDLILEDFYNPTRQRVLARNLSLFSVTRVHRIGLRFVVEQQAQVRDFRGFPKVQRFQLSDALQLPE